MFDLKVDEDGYAWWYLDAISDDQRYALTVIAFIGSVFSPYYARARKKGSANPLQHCAINAIIYGKGVGRWAMTERSATAMQRSPDHLQIGPSQISIDKDGLRIQTDEITVPIPRRLRGEILVNLPNRLNRHFDLDQQGKHQWSPIAPCCRVEVNLEYPRLQWQGNGYFDHNRGSEPIEKGFKGWNWSRLNLESGETAVIYDRQLRDLSQQNLMLTFDASGSLINEQHEDILAHQTDFKQSVLPLTPIWRMPRSIRYGPSTLARVVRTLEDTPFYSRSELAMKLHGMSATGIHESVSLDRLINPIVQLMLPFRMPRRR